MKERDSSPVNSGAEEILEALTASTFHIAKHQAIVETLKKEQVEMKRHLITTLLDNQCFDFLSVDMAKLKKALYRETRNHEYLKKAPHGFGRDEGHKEAKEIIRNLSY